MKHFVILIMLLVTQGVFSQGVLITKVDETVIGMVEYNGLIFIDYVDKTVEKSGTIVINARDEVITNINTLDQKYFESTKKSELKSAISIMQERDESYFDMRREYKKQIGFIEDRMFYSGVTSISKHKDRVAMIFSSSLEDGAEIEGSIVVLFDIARSRYVILFGSDKNIYDNILLVDDYVYYSIGGNVFKAPILWTTNVMN